MIENDYMYLVKLVCITYIPTVLFLNNMCVCVQKNTPEGLNLYTKNIIFKL